MNKYGQLDFEESIKEGLEEENKKLRIINDYSNKVTEALKRKIDADDRYHKPVDRKEKAKARLERIVAQMDRLEAERKLKVAYEDLEGQIKQPKI